MSISITEVLHKVGGRIISPFNHTIIFKEEVINMYVETLESDDPYVNTSDTYNTKSPVSKQYLIRADFNRYMDRYNATMGDGGDVRNKFLDNAIIFEGDYVYFEGQIVVN